MKIVFFGTSNVALPILEALNKAYQIVGVVTTPDAKAGRKQEFAESPVSALAKDLNLPTIKPLNPKTDRSFLNQLRDWQAELFVVVSFGKILPLEAINLPKYKSINVHFSPLPKYRGPSPIQAALLNGDKQTGASIFVLDELVDHGPLIAQEIVSIQPNDTFFTLSQRLAHLSAKTIVETIRDYAGGRITPLPQDDSSATFTREITKKDGKVDWTKSAQEIYNQFRAFFPWPGIWTTWNGKKIKITDCAPLYSPSPLLSAVALAKADAGEGRLVRRSLGGGGGEGVVADGGIVACGPASSADRQNTFLQIKSLQLEGKKETAISDFLNGYKDFVGSGLK